MTKLKLRLLGKMNFSYKYSSRLTNDLMLVVVSSIWESSLVKIDEYIHLGGSALIWFAILFIEFWYTSSMLMLSLGNTFILQIMLWYA